MRTVSRCSPNSLETSRMLLPSTITARRTRRYTSTLYIHRTTHKFDLKPMNGGGRSNLQPPFVRDYPPARDNLPPPLTDRKPRQKPPANLANEERPIRGSMVRGAGLAAGRPGHQRDGIAHSFAVRSSGSIQSGTPAYPAAESAATAAHHGQRTGPRRLSRHASGPR